MNGIAFPKAMAYSGLIFVEVQIDAKFKKCAKQKKTERFIKRIHKDH